MRDYFFTPTMHGVDWEAKREQYAQLLPYVNHRIDLTYVIGEMISELNIGHAYVGGGDYPKAEKIKLGLLGAKLERDASSKYYRVVKILKGQNWDSNVRSPLTEIGVDMPFARRTAVNFSLRGQRQLFRKQLTPTPLIDCELGTCRYTAHFKPAYLCET